ncbi:Ig-like domain-containing protein [Herbinix luporum]|uniref:Ig-like domain-containing protein n=1 Tax=Herbinix luporum TaxID=1679721 RepID=UPI0017735249|nr:Ig-like domain-containing protein [Herbinix luporum]HHT58009.1 Ig domain-containing protein [Herbinix luporum]
MKFLKKTLFATLLSLIMVTASSIPHLTNPVTVEAATIKLNKTKITLDVGDTYQLKLTGTNKKVTWSSSKKSVATVSSKGKVTAKKAGKATITAKVGSKKYTCKVTVKHTIRIDNKKLSLNMPSNWNISSVNFTIEISDLSFVEILVIETETELPYDMLKYITTNLLTEDYIKSEIAEVDSVYDYSVKDLKTSNGKVLKITCSVDISGDTAAIHYYTFTTGNQNVVIYGLDDGTDQDFVANIEKLIESVTIK